MKLRLKYLLKRNLYVAGHVGLFRLNKKKRKKGFEKRNINLHLRYVLCDKSHTIK